MLRRLFAVIFAAFACAVSPVIAGEQTFMFDVPRSSVDVALNSIAQQANAQVLFPFDKAKSIKAKTVSGEYTLAEALRLTLDGTGLVADFTKSGAITVTFGSEQSKLNGEEHLPMKTKQKLSLLSKVALLIFGATNITGVSAQDTASQAEVMEEVIVKGVIRQNQQIIDAKRSTDGIADFLTSDDIGKLPDFNIADAIRRISGVNTIFDEDEGQFVALRGLNADFTHTEFDGGSVAAVDLGGFFGDGKKSTSRIRSCWSGKNSGSL